METVNDKQRLNQFIESRHIMDYFSSCRPDFFLFHYYPGELLTNPFSPSLYVQFVVEGELLLYDMPDENSTISLQTAYNEVRILGEVELLDTQFTPFFVEAVSDVYTVALLVERYRDALLNDTAFLRYLCMSLSIKLKGAVTASIAMPLKQRLAIYIGMADKTQPIKDIARLSKSFNVSSRQLLRVLREFCDSGFLERRDKGTYYIIETPPY